MKHVTQWDYLWEPVIAGGATALLLIVFIGLIGVPYSAEHCKVRLYRKKFWTEPLHASSAWTFTDSWATNITALGTAVVVILSTGDTLKVIFPGVGLSPFIVMSVMCGGIIAVAPILFGVVNVICRSDQSDNDMIAADMRSLIPAAALTTFGIGTEIWMVGLLARQFSDRNMTGYYAAWVISIVALVGLIVYGGTSIWALAHTEHGSSLSARSRTSFTL
jgi:hypothetical protein